MVEMALPSGLVVDFEDASDAEIETTLIEMQKEQPELFEEVEVQEAPDLGTASYEELREYYQGTEGGAEAAPAFEPTHAGEIESHSFQFDYGKADTDEERALRLEHEFGPGSYQQVGRDDFVLNLDNVTPEKKAQYKLPESGTMRVNQPGFSSYDLSGFGGAYRGPLATTLATGFFTAGTGLIPSMIAMGAAGGAGKLMDETIETQLGFQRQTDNEVWGDVATEAAFMAAGEGIGRGIFALGRRLIKGPGPKPDAARVDELASNLMAQGMARGKAVKQATRAAVEERRVELRGLVSKKDGPRPTVQEVSGKALMGRLQAIYEQIFPNATAARTNRDYVMKLLEQYGAGDITEQGLKKSLNTQAQAISRLIQQRMKDPDEAVRLANQQLQGVIEKEFDILQQLYKPGERMAVDFEKMMAQNVRLFRANSDNLYQQADDLLGEAAHFDTTPIKKAFDEMRGIDAAGKVISEQKKALAPGLDNTALFKYIDSLGATISLKDLSSLRPFIRMQSKDPGMIGKMIDGDISNALKAIDESIIAKELAINETLSQVRPGQWAPIKATEGTLPGGGKYTEVKFTDPADFQKIKDGLGMYRAANKHYEDGMKVFNSGNVGMVEKNIADHYFVDLASLNEAVVQGGRPETLKFWLNAVTPDEPQLVNLKRVNPSVFKEIESAALNPTATVDRLGQASIGPAEQINALLTKNNIDKTMIARLPTWLDDLPADDFYRRSVLKDFAEQMNMYGSDAFARANPQTIRNATRDMLAGEWLRETARVSRGAEGELSGSAFAQAFNALDAPGETRMQNALFGAENAARMKGIVKDFTLVGKAGPELSQKVVSNITSRDAQGIVGSLQETLRIAEEQSQNALFKAVRNGTIDDADELVMAVMKNPRSLNQLRSALGDNADAVLDAPNGLQDMVMHKIMLQAFPDGITTDAVASGAFAQNMRKTISQMNSNGALAKVLTTSERAGQEVVDDLLKVAKMGETISDAAFKGKAGLAPAAFIAGAGYRAVTAPVSFLGEVAGIMAMGRIMRSRPFLKFMTSPQLSSYHTKQAIRAGAKGLDKRNLALLQLRELAYQTARMYGSVEAARGYRRGSEIVEEVAEEITPTAKKLVAQVSQQPAAPPQQPQPQMPAQQPQAPVPQIPAAVAQPSPLLQAEINKLYGMPPV